MNLLRTFRMMHAVSRVVYAIVRSHRSRKKSRQVLGGTNCLASIKLLLLHEPRRIFLTGS
jgi:hypothetical protein